MNSFERFLAGKDPIARLICDQPAFEPSAEQEERLLAAITSLPQTQPETLEFEAPQHMEATFLQTMHAAQQAQAPRRAALINRLQHGIQPAAVLGHPISAATQDWLASQAIPLEKQAQTPRPANKMPWWQWSSMLLASALVTVIGIRVFFPSQPAQSVETALNLSIPKPAMAPQESIPLQRSEKLDSPSVPETRVAQLAPTESQRSATLPVLKKHTSQGSIAPPPVQVAAPTGPTPTSEIPPRLALTDQRKTEAAKTAHAKDADMVVLAPPAPPPLMESAQTKLAAAPPAAAPITQPLPVARKAVSSAPHSRSILLSDNPVDIAHSLSSDWTGQALILHAADPQNPAIQDWAARLRTALPPETQLTLQRAPELDAHHMLLIRQ